MVEIIVMTLVIIGLIVDQMFRNQSRSSEAIINDLRKRLRQREDIYYQELKASVRDEQALCRLISELNKKLEMVTKEREEYKLKYKSNERTMGSMHKYVTDIITNHPYSRFVERKLQRLEYGNGPDRVFCMHRMKLSIGQRNYEEMIMPMNGRQFEMPQFSLRLDFSFDPRDHYFLEQVVEQFVESVRLEIYREFRSNSILIDYVYKRTGEQLIFPKGT